MCYLILATEILHAPLVSEAIRYGAQGGWKKRGFPAHTRPPQNHVPFDSFYISFMTDTMCTQVREMRARRRDLRYIRPVQPIAAVQEPAPPGSQTQDAAAPAAKAGRVKCALRRGGLLSRLFDKHSWELDFNQGSACQMVCAPEMARARHADRTTDLPIVRIGHSQFFNPYNAGQLSTFLEYVASRPEDIDYGTFGDFDLERFRRPG